MEQVNKEYKFNSDFLKGKPPTEKQINYAKTLARKNGVGVPTGDRYDFFIFINQYTGKKDTAYAIKKRNPITLTERQWDIDHLKGKSGVYVFFGKHKKVLYIGKSYDLASRIPTSFNEKSSKENRITCVKCFVCDTKADANILELMLISENHPLLNRDCNTNDKPIMFMSGFNVYDDFDDVPFPKEKKIEVYPEQIVADNP